MPVENLSAADFQQLIDQGYLFVKGVLDQHEIAALRGPRERGGWIQADAEPGRMKSRLLIGTQVPFAVVNAPTRRLMRSYRGVVRKRGAEINDPSLASFGRAGLRRDEHGEWQMQGLTGRKFRLPRGISVPLHSDPPTSAGIQMGIVLSGSRVVTVWQPTADGVMKPTEKTLRPGDAFLQTEARDWPTPWPHEHPLHEIATATPETEGDIIVIMWRRFSIATLRERGLREIKRLVGFQPHAHADGNPADRVGQVVS